MTNYTTKEVHIRYVRSGDTILHQGKLMTVCSKDIKYCEFMGRSIFGDSYHSGHKAVTLVSLVQRGPRQSFEPQQ